MTQHHYTLTLTTTDGVTRPPASEVVRAMFDGLQEHDRNVALTDVIGASVDGERLPPSPEPSLSGMIDIVFDGPPSAEAGRFVEVEDVETGKSISIGEWIDRKDGTWALRVIGNGVLG